MTSKYILVACSGLNARGNVTRAVVSDITSSDEDFEYSCIVACGGGNQKHIQRTLDYKTISINGCDKACPKKILECVGGKVDECVDIKSILTRHDLLPEDAVRIGQREEDCIKIIKEEVYKLVE